MISVIVPTYNSEKYIKKCITSIVKQKKCELEILVVDNGSVDNTKNIVKEFAQKDKRIRLIQCPIKGVSNARNMGIEYSKGEYISFVDSDDYIDEDFYYIMLDSLEKQKVELSVCEYNQIFEDEKEITKEKKYGISNLNKVELLDKMFDKDFFQGFVWNRLYKSEIIKNNNVRFNTEITICEDFLFNCEYMQYIEKACYINQPLYYYVQRKSSSYNSQINRKWFTVFKAYEQIEKICLDNNFTNLDGLIYHKFKVNLLLKEKIFFNNKEFKYEKKIVNNNIKKYSKKIFFSKEIKLIEKIKLFLKKNFIFFYLIIKKIKKEIKK